MAREGAGGPAIRAEAGATLRLAWPLIIAQLATVALMATDVVMTGWLGPAYLAAGSLSTSVFYPLVMFGQGVGMAAAPMMAQALGARRPRDVRRIVRAGLWLALGLGLALSLVLYHGDHLLRWMGQDAGIVALARTYLGFAAWMVAPNLVFVVLRGLVSAHGDTRVVLRITLVGIVLNAGLNYLLMFGHFGLPRLALRGAGIATTTVHLGMALLLLAHVLRVRPFRRYAVLARFHRPDPARLRAIWATGAPVGLMLTAESGLFSVAAVMMGWIGADALAGHAVALQLAAIAFMVPMGLSHATAVRVGLAVGRGDRAGTARAGWISIALSMLFMGCVAAVFVSLPGPLIGAFLDRADPANAAAVAFAGRFLLVAALFQLVDGAQVTGAAALRGLGDTRVPMWIALAGYWAIGVPVAWGLAFPAGLGGIGLWLGLASGLAAAAVMLCLRFARLTRSDVAAPGERSEVAEPGEVDRLEQRDLGLSRRIAR